ncbi:MAG: glutamate synthase-related protein, partial [Rubrivivax sp.]
SMAPTVPPTHDCRVRIGSAGSACTQPYSASVFNISAMSFGLVSAAAVLALNAGARRGGLAHDTGGFSAERFAQQARDPPIKMIEIKLSRGAKPGHGGVLPGPKVTAEIAAARGVPAGVDGVSPAAHSAFSTSLELLQFVERLRQLFGGKPVGFKLCIGHPRECFAVAKAMLDSGLLPDFIVVDGAEGGTGAAPLELTDPVGVPLQEGLLLVHNTLVGLNLRERIRIGCAGKVTSAFDIAQLMAPGSLLAAAQGAGPWPHKVFELFWPVAQASSFRPAASFPESSDAR